MERGPGKQVSAGFDLGFSLEGVRATLDEVALSLTSPTPEVLDRAALRLKPAVACLLEARNRCQEGGGGPGDLDEMRRVRLAISRAGALLEKAQQYHAGWIAYLGARTGGYRAGGQPAPLLRPSRFFAEA